MQIFKCKMCGGDIVPAENQAYGTCDSCGGTMTLPRASDERKANLFNRANHFRRVNDFGYPEFRIIKIERNRCAVDTTNQFSASQ